MERVNSKRNQYRGINAHLHSFLQGENKWNRFHNVHISDLMKVMQSQLDPIGYIAETEESVQIRRVGDALRLPCADILIRDNSSWQPIPSLFSAADRPQTLTVEALLEDEEDWEHPYSAIVIHAQEVDGATATPVAWIELLSPTNKGDTPDAQTYRAKRRLLLEQGMIFVEIDYLHETPPTFARFADYTLHGKNSHSFRIIILDPRPDFRHGPVTYVEFDVDSVIPAMTIPLNGSDSFVCDFSLAYHKTFEEALYGRHYADYTRLPLNIDRYSTDDQARILNRMLAVLEAAQHGLDLEQNAPLTVKALPLEAAQAQLQTLGVTLP
jgi:Protein of unknown function (DUF4058)